MSGSGDQMNLLPEAAECGDDGAHTEVFPARRGPGRPKGALNRKTEQLQKLWSARGFKDPLMLQGEFMSSHPADLWRWFVTEQAKVDGLSPAEAIAKAMLGKLDGVPTIPEIVAMQLKTADQVAPYLHGKMPVRDDDGEDERLPVLVVDLGTDQVSQGRYAGGADEPMSIGAPVEGQSEQNQGLSGNEE
ncbi:hypothetical protein [Breoghania sp.]|uniref:hypothetical protein n=1 Tax=Breoghania sp. TaxID=2065378 RepID=UPI002AA745CA|nr:hypothetical protein [Breoghania sp.]